MPDTSPRRTRLRLTLQDGNGGRIDTEAKTTPKGITWTTVVSVNLHRRHLVTSQRAIVAAKLLPIYEEQAAERQKKSGGDKKSSKKSVPANLPEPIKGDARDKAGAALNVSGKVVDMAAKVLSRATVAATISPLGVNTFFRDASIAIYWRRL